MTTRRKQNALSAAVVRALMIPGTYSDGNGLTLRWNQEEPNTGSSG